MEGDGELSFEYADADGAWQDRWRPPIEARERIPRTVRLVSTEGATAWLARLDFHPVPAPTCAGGSERLERAEALLHQRDWPER